MNQNIVTPSIYSENTSSAESWNTGMNSFLRCISEHPRCREESSRSKWNPTRLIDVGTNDDPMLKLFGILHSGEELVYTTLSHCWDSLKIHKLLDSNIAAMMISIEPSQLTKTFQNAIRVTRLLGVQYLWIDSLCIIQGSWRTGIENLDSWVAYIKMASATLQRPVQWTDEEDVPSTGIHFLSNH